MDKLQQVRGFVRFMAVCCFVAACGPLLPSRSAAYYDARDEWIAKTGMPWPNPPVVYSDKVKGLGSGQVTLGETRCDFAGRPLYIVIYPRALLSAGAHEKSTILHEVVHFATTCSNFDHLADSCLMAQPTPQRCEAWQEEDRGLDAAAIDYIRAWPVPLGVLVDE